MHRSHRLELDAELERQIDDLARASGISAADLVRDAIEAYAATHPRGETNGGETLFDRWSSKGFIGCVKGDKNPPTDLSTNPAHMEGFGLG